MAKQQKKPRQAKVSTRAKQQKKPRQAKVSTRAKQQKKPRQAKVSTRARKYIQNKVAGMSDYQAAVNAGYSKNTAIAAADNIENPSVKLLMNELMDKKGLTDDHLIDVLSEGLHESSKIHGTDNNFVEIPDYMVRHKYLETALKIKGKLVDRKDITSGGKPIPILGGITNVPSDNSDQQTSET